MKIISLFCGLGGFDLGALGGFAFLGRRYKPLGNRIVLATDVDREACAIYAENLGSVRCADVRDVRGWPEADAILAGPPCQPFSRAGKRSGSKDQRNMIPEFIRSVSDVLPRVFVMENVPALARSVSDRSYFERLTDELRGLGYGVEWRILNAADFGVPQTRERLFVQGVRGDSDEAPIWPDPTHAEEQDGKKRPWVTARQAMADISTPYNDMRIRHLAEGQRRYGKNKGGARRQIADRPLFTITAQDTAGSKKLHPWFDRALTLAELKRGMGFPDDFILPSRTRALGNAVPPVLAHHICRKLLKI